MRRIFKYELSVSNAECIIVAPIVKPLHVDFQNGSPYLWAMIDDKAMEEEWVVHCVGTGWDMDNVFNYEIFTISYLNSTVESSKPYVWHWFCRKLIQGFDV